MIVKTTDVNNFTIAKYIIFIDRPTWYLLSIFYKTCYDTT